MCISVMLPLSYRILVLKTHNTFEGAFLTLSSVPPVHSLHACVCPIFAAAAIQTCAILKTDQLILSINLFLDVQKKQKSLLSVFHLVHLHIPYSTYSAIKVACTFSQRACFSGTETMTWPLVMPCFTRNHIWPLVIFSLVIQPGIFLKAIMNFMQETTCSSSHFPVAGTGKLKLSSSLASSCALILILTSCEGGFDSCCGLLMRGTPSSQTPASSFLSPELEPKITIPGE